jgi:hypothetical protein
MVPDGVECPVSPAAVNVLEPLPLAPLNTPVPPLMENVPSKVPGFPKDWREPGEKKERPGKQTTPSSSRRSVLPSDRVMILCSVMSAQFVPSIGSNERMSRVDVA